MITASIALDYAKKNTKTITKIKRYVEDLIEKAIENCELETEFFIEMDRKDKKELLDWLVSKKYLVIIQTNGEKVYNYIICWAKKFDEGKVVIL